MSPRPLRVQGHSDEDILGTDHIRNSRIWDQSARSTNQKGKRWKGSSQLTTCVTPRGHVRPMGMLCTLSARGRNHETTVVIVNPQRRQGK